MEEAMARMLEEAQKNADKMQEGRPFVYGWSMRVGPDGKPKIEEFGNVPNPQVGLHQIPDEREPLTDVIEGDREVSVIIELPGVERNDIKLDASEKNLLIKVDTQNRKYSKDMELPCEVKPESAKATYKNGILEVKLEKAKQKDVKKGVHIKVD